MVLVSVSMTNPTCKSGLSPFKRQDTLLRGLLFCHEQRTGNRRSNPAKEAGMTKGEYLIMQRDRQKNMAIQAYREKDYSGARMHNNIADGYQSKLEKLTIAELGAHYE